VSLHFSRRALLAAALAISSLTLVDRVMADQSIRVGIMSAEDEDVWAVVSQEAAKQGLTIELVVFNDYTQPFQQALNAPLTGHGIGLGTLAGARLTTGKKVFLLAESEWSRIVLGWGFAVFTAGLSLAALNPPEDEIAEETDDDEETEDAALKPT